ncbi:MAG: NADH-quinone oxidoreductase subunit NuoG [Thermoanaerobaculales bacterium]|jgi:NADH-quinone oxidoreductase subunit G|nr:NADH-quinone oxidoreductase subunit NuoG [Thermoanaerobaculales bacterium]
MVKIFVEDREHEVEEGQNLLQAVLGLGCDLPYFCWHPALGSMGACRACAVKQFRDADDETGMIIMACMTPVSDGLRVSVDDPEAREFRTSILEWYMTNHPHDCPVCDEGGECHLQDMTVMSGHRDREYRFTKRTHRNQNLGPFINHEMNRCIACYRCVRFYRDLAGGADFNVFGSRNRVYFGRVADGALESPFSGNLVEVCPTGVFTDKSAKARTVRPWDLQTAPSVCMLCGLGCNTIPGERNGVLRRIRNRYHGEINRYFLCDRGRFGVEFVNSPRRIRHPVVRTGVASETAAAEAVVDHVAALVTGGETVGIGSTRASLEANFALRRLVGAENFFMGIGSDEADRLRSVMELLESGPARTPTLHEVARADAVLILGEDVTNTAPLLDLAVRRAVLNKPKEQARELGIPDWNDVVNRLVVNGRCGPLHIATVAPTALDRLATETVRAAPPDIARFAAAVAAIIAGETLGPDLPGPDADRAAGSAAATLTTAKRPLIISGMGSESRAVIEAAGRLARVVAAANPAAALSLVVPDCNSVGAGLLGAPGLGDAGTRDHLTAVIVLEPDPSTRERRAELAAVIDRASHTVVIDHLESPLSEAAEVVLPAATFAEGNGTVVNNEGRAQRFYQVFVPADEVRASWQWLRQVCRRVHGDDSAPWAGPDEMAESMSEEFPVLEPLGELAPEPPGGPSRRVPRQSHRVTGRTSVNAHRQIREPKPPEDHESPMAFSMEGSPRRPPADLIARYWSPGWNSVQALAMYQEEIGGSLRGGDPGVRVLGRRAGETDEAPDRTPDAFAPRNNEWLLVPLHHLYGSETLSMETPGVAEQAPPPYLALGVVDAGRLGVASGDTLEVTVDGETHRLPLRIIEDLPAGCAGLADGLPGLSDFPAGRWAGLRRSP